jgi:transcription antitermination factor NusG
LLKLVDQLEIAKKKVSVENSWFAIYVASRQEKKVTDLLLSKGIEAYVPLVKTLRQWSDRKKMVEFPLLTGYVFVRSSMKDFDKILQTKGVVNFVRYCGKVAKVRDEEVSRIKQLIELGYSLEINPISKEFKTGDKIKITSGALKNFEGYISQTLRGKFFEVVLDSIGQVIKVTLPEQILTNVS